MEDHRTEILILWRGKKFDVQISPSATLKELGDEMQKLTKVKAETMRFIVPQSSQKSSRLLTPFSSEHERLSLQETFMIEGKPIRMMGVSENEVEEILQAENLNLRIAGFDEEEKRLRQRMSHGPRFAPKLPQGPYTFCDFRTLQLPGIELKPPPSEALKRMHMLASDPGIVAIMNKHRWRVGIMTEMAPEGYVGISPKCILGFNKNQGEEISLRLRTDDLKGFRKYEMIKKTLLHELAHMVHSEHDANFFALDSQLNKEANSLDWTRSTSHTLSRAGRSDRYDEEFDSGEDYAISQKLGGNASDKLASARMASVVAAYRRIADAPAISSGIAIVHEEPDPDSLNEFDREEPDPDDVSDHENNIDADFDESKDVEEEENPESLPPSEETKILDSSETRGQKNINEPDPDESTVSEGNSGMQIDELVPDDEDLRRIRDPVTAACDRLKKAIELLRAEVGHAQTIVVLQTLFKIVSKVIEHPNETKFRRLRKANPVIQRTIANYRASMELLALIGFNEEVVSDEMGNAETYLVLKRNDPGFLWLAKSCIEMNASA